MSNKKRITKKSNKKRITKKSNKKKITTGVVKKKCKKWILLTQPQVEYVGEFDDNKTVSCKKCKRYTSHANFVHDPDGDYECINDDCDWKGGNVGRYLYYCTRCKYKNDIE